MVYISENLHFERDVTVSVFETTIRVLGFTICTVNITGGLISIHNLAEQHKHRFTKPYEGAILEKARDLGDKMLPAFDSPTGIPFSRVNFLRGPPRDDNPETCTAGAGTLILEWGALSRLTGDPKYEVFLP